MRILKKELWPYKLTLSLGISNTKLVDIEIWLGENLGAFKSKWNVVYCNRNTDFYFRSEQDAMLFILRWL
jgi:uncharacterized membrane protein YoaT (DUF817 family)